MHPAASSLLRFSAGVFLVLGAFTALVAMKES